MVRNSNIGQGGHYRLSKALKIINEQVIHPFSQTDLLKEAVNGELRLLCSLGSEIPLMRKAVVFCDDEPGVMATESVLVGVDCFNGFFYLDEVPNGEGNKHLAALAGGRQSAGISAIRWREGDEEQNRSIADLQEAGLSCGDAHFWFGIDWNPEYINTGRIFPTVDDLYVFQDDLVVFLRVKKNTQEGDEAVIVECSCPASESTKGNDGSGKDGSAKVMASDLVKAYRLKTGESDIPSVKRLLLWNQECPVSGYGVVTVEGKGNQRGVYVKDVKYCTYSSFSAAMKRMQDSTKK